MFFNMDLVRCFYVRSLLGIFLYYFVVIVIVKENFVNGIKC